MIKYFLTALFSPFFLYAETSTFYLKNGMQVIISTDDRAPLVICDLWYKVGSADAPTTQSGVAHFLEHMMFQGTDSMPPGRFRLKLSHLGSFTNAETSYDTTHYFSIVPKENLGKLLALESDRMQNLKIDPFVFQKEKNVVLQERLSRMENNAHGMAFEAINQRFFSTHPYAAPVIGWRNEIEALTEENLYTFYKTWYAPNNSILVLVGDITLQEAKKLTQKHFGSIMPRKVPRRHRVTLPQNHFGMQTLTFKHPQFSNDVEHIYRVDHLILNTKNRIILRLIAGALQDKLHNYLSLTQNATYNVNAVFETGTKDPYRFSISASIKHTGSKDRVNSLITGFLASLKQSGFTQSELEIQKKSFLNTYYTRMSSLEKRGHFFGQNTANGVHFSTLIKFPSILEQITRTDINTILSLLFSQQNVFIVESLYGEEIV